MTRLRITLADIAKQAGVHVTTVSAALRNHPRLPLSTKQRIQELAQKMGYRPDPALASLVAYRTQKNGIKHSPTLGYVTNWDTRWGWKNASAHADFFTGASARAAALGYMLEHFWLGEPGLTHRRLSEILYTRNITGLILASHRREADAEIAFDWSKFSAVKIDFAPHRPTLHHVTNNQRAIMQLAVSRALELGYRRIGCVMPRWWDAFVDRAWSAGFLGEQQLLAAEDRLPILFFSEEHHEAAVSPEAFRDWYEEHRPEVVITCSDFVSNALQCLDLAVPDDLCLIDLFLKRFDGSTAGIRQNCARVGEVAVELLVGQLQHFNLGLPAYPISTFVEGTWFDGETLPARSEALAAGSAQ